MPIADRGQVCFGPNKYINLWHIPSTPNRRLVKKKVKCTLVQAMRLCIGRTAHRGSRGIALLCHDHGTRRGWGVSITPGPLFTSGKTRYPLYRSLGGPQGRSGQVRKISPPPGFDPRTFQPVASRCTDYATQPKQTFESHRYISPWYISCTPNRRLSHIDISIPDTFLVLQTDVWVTSLYQSLTHS